MTRFLLVAGARPNFMKIAPILEAFARRANDEFTVKLVHTGQHYDAAMSGAFFADLHIPQPDINLGVGSGSHAEQTARVMVAFEQVCRAERPDWVIVVGDVNSTLACSLTARKMGILVAHVEAGLRSGDLSMPEEINRRCTDTISDVLYTTDVLAGENLLGEGVPAHKIEFVGNTMIDTLHRHLPRALALPLPAGLRPGEFAVVTLHRPSNVDAPEVLGPLFGAIREIARSLPVVFPIHPRTRKNLEAFGLLDPLPGEPRIHFRVPLAYLPFISLVSRARLILTDSGGIQEETTVLGVPCLTIRENTERPITCSLGTNVLVGMDPGRIVREARAAIAAGPRQPVIPPKWDGGAAERIVDSLLSHAHTRRLAAAAAAG